MNRTPVESEMLVSVGYDPVDEILELEFHTSGIYQYSEVPEEIYRELMAAESKGRYFIEYIQDQYPYLRVARGRHR
jgi:hypothetical protein